MGSRTSKHTRATARRVSKTTKRPDAVTANERDEAERTLLQGGQLDAVRAGYFCEHQYNLPIAGTQRPLPCPFCGKTHEVSVEIKDERDPPRPHVSVRVWCGVCGAEAPPATTNDEGIVDVYAAILEAARLWNTRGGGQ